uniref:RNA polymerase II transcription factor B subunit 5 n=1 Tax=Steinernema glaseri TaxID=37863 RepID=A0A1I8A660_9BILA
MRKTQKQWYLDQKAMHPSIVMHFMHRILVIQVLFKKPGAVVLITRNITILQSTMASQTLTVVSSDGVEFKIKIEDVEKVLTLQKMLSFNASFAESSIPLPSRDEERNANDDGGEEEGVKRERTE